MPKRDDAHMKAQRERILRATLQCISEVGIERTSIAEIRKRSQLSAGALYTHFASKDEIVAAALRFGGSDDDYQLPNDWPAFTAWVANVRGSGDFDFATVARTQLQVIASSVRPGPLHDTLKPMIERTLGGIVRHLEAMERDGRIRLRLSPVQTALAISALKDGMGWIALSRDRPLKEVERDLAAALDCLVDHAAG